MSGQCEFLLKTETGVQTLLLDQIGEYVVVPKGIWHTAKIAKSAKVLFITPSEHTQNVDHPALL
jgi:quercetin dioxygenase-like cupin family protein